MPMPLPEAANDALERRFDPDTARVSGARVVFGAMAGAAIIGLPAALIGYGIDEGLHAEEPSEDPGLVGFYSGLAIGAGLGGVLGAHIGSGGRGSPWISLGIVGAGAPLMLIAPELGLLASATGIVVSVTIELDVAG